LRRKLATHFFCVNNFANFFSSAAAANERDDCIPIVFAVTTRKAAFAKKAENEGIFRDIENAIAIRAHRGHPIRASFRT